MSKKTDQAAIEAIETLFSHTFQDKQRVLRALTHASAGDKDYERLEFLGDRVVNLVVAELLYLSYPKEQEGDLARRHTAFVRGEALARIARTLGIDAHLRLSGAEKMSGGAENSNILADTMEALIAALYLDAGYDAARRFLTDIMHEEIAQMQAPPIDPKTQLQEWSQGQNMGLPLYTVLERSGPDHDPLFTVEVALDATGQKATGQGSSKRMAEKSAAQKLLKLLNVTE